MAGCAAILTAYIPITAVSASLPTIARGVSASTSELTWVLVAFTLPLAAFILTAGSLGDLFGRKRLLLTGLGFMAVGNLLVLISASSVYVVWLAQAVAGVGAAILLPTSLAVVTAATPDPRQRSAAIAAWASCLSLGLVCGLWLAALVLDGAGASWRWVFLATVPILLAALAFSVWAVDDSTSREGRGLDPWGQVTGVLLVVGLVFGVVEGPGLRWTSPVVVTAFVVAALAPVGFVLAERHSATPMLDLSLFRSPAFSVTSLVAALVMFGLIGTIFVLSLFFGSVQQLSVVGIAVRFTLLTAVIVPVGPLAGRLASALGPRVVMTAGLVVVGGGLLTLLSVQADSGLGVLWWRLAVIGAGFGLVLTPMTGAAIAAAPKQLAGMAGSANNAFRQTGGALGPAVLGAILAHGIAGALPGALQAGGVAAATGQQVTGVVDAQGIGAVAGLPPATLTPQVLQATGEAFIAGLHSAALVAGVTLLLAALACAVLLRTPAGAPSKPSGAGEAHHDDGAQHQGARHQAVRERGRQGVRSTSAAPAPPSG